MGCGSKVARVFADVFTLGLAEIGFQIADSVSGISDSAGAAGAAFGVIALTIQKVGDETAKLLVEIEKQLVIVRSAPRDEADLWDEEKERLDALRLRLSQLQAELASEFPTVPPIWPWNANFWRYFKKLMAIVSVQGEINNILYREPGVVPQLLENTAETVERFNEIEQPKIEDILDSVDDNLEESEQVLEQVKKLFVVKKFVPKPDFEISSWDKDVIKFHDTRIAGMMSEIQSRMTFASGYSTLKGSLLPIDYKMKKQFVASGSGSGGAHPDGGSPDKGPSVGFASGTAVPAVSRASMMNAYGLKKSAVFAKVESLELARISLAQREIIKSDKLIGALKFKLVEEPGVIPLTLEEIRKTIQRVNSIEQPKIEQILDSVDANLKESQGILDRVNALTGGVVNFILGNALLIKIAVILSAIFIVITLALMPLLVIRMIFFGL